MKEIPVTLVKANQTMLVGLTILSILLQSSLLLGLTVAIVYGSLLFGQKANPAMLFITKVIKKDLSNDDKEAVVLQRFNQTIAAVLLTIGFLLSIIWSHWGVWVPVGMVTIAASIALMGFCVGCYMYYQYKKISHERRKSA